MSDSGLTLLLMAGCTGNSEPERVLQNSHVAAAEDLLGKASRIDIIDTTILVTNCSHLAERWNKRKIQIELTAREEVFDFGTKFCEIIRKYSLEDLLYFGAGSGILMETGDLVAMANWVKNNRRGILANNFYSVDFLGVTPATALLDVELSPRDNSLGWRAREAGLAPHELPRSPKSQFDIDSPGDLRSLHVSGRVTGKLSAYLETVDLGTEPLDRLLPIFTATDSRLVLAGRVGASTWSYLEREAACHISVFSEGRGLAASDNSGQQSNRLLRGVANQEGPKGLIDKLARAGDGVVLDSRLLLPTRQNWPSAADRYWSDLGHVDPVEDQFLEQLTRSARSASVPVVLGGHSMVSGGLLLLADAAWEQVESTSELIRPVTCEWSSMGA